MPTEVLHATDSRRHGTRALLRVEISDRSLIIVVHELGPARGPDGQERMERWLAWLEQLEPPSVSDDIATDYTLQETRTARGQGGNPGHSRLPMKATVSWHFGPPPPASARRWTIDGRWIVERPR